MDTNSFNFVVDVVITLHQNVRELRERKAFAAPEELDYIDGKLQAYNEVLGTLRSAAREFGLPEKELGL
jgi:hypothetical protein